MKKAKIIAILCFSTISLFSLFSEQFVKPNVANLSWQIFNQAEERFEDDDFGEAYKLAQKALDERRHEVKWVLSVLNNSLKPYEVHKVGDSFNSVLEVLKKREDFAAVSIIENFEEKKGKAFFKDSVKNLQEYIAKNYEYPEAYFLLAKIYRIEGEYNISEGYLKRAYDNSALLEIPNQKYDILYEQAALAKIQNKNYEDYLQLIVANDSFYFDNTLKTSILRSIKSTKKDSAEHFFMLYRVDSPFSVKAYYELSLLYEKNKKMQDSLVMNLLCNLSSFTHINTILEDRNPLYSYTTLNAFFDECSRWSDVCAWCIENNFWASLCRSTQLCKDSSANAFAEQLLEELIANCPEEYWRKEAKELIKSYQ